MAIICTRVGTPFVVSLAVYWTITVFSINGPSPATLDQRSVSTGLSARAHIFSEKDYSVLAQFPGFTDRQDYKILTEPE